MTCRGEAFPQLEPEWAQVAQAFENDQDVLIARVHAISSPDIRSLAAVEGAPSFVYYEKGLPHPET